MRIWHDKFDAHRITFSNRCVWTNHFIYRAVILRIVLNQAILNIEHIHIWIESIARSVCVTVRLIISYLFILILLGANCVVDSNILSLVFWFYLLSTIFGWTNERAKTTQNKIANLCRKSSNYRAVVTKQRITRFTFDLINNKIKYLVLLKLLRTVFEHRKSFEYSFILFLFIFHRIFCMAWLFLKPCLTTIHRSQWKAYSRKAWRTDGEEKQ